MTCFQLLLFFIKRIWIQLPLTNPTKPQTHPLLLSFFLSVPQTQHNQRTDTHKGTNKVRNWDGEQWHIHPYFLCSTFSLPHFLFFFTTTSSTSHCCHEPLCCMQDFEEKMCWEMCSGTVFPSHWTCKVYHCSPCVWCQQHHQVPTGSAHITL